jgi:hypothetical protein
VHPEQAPGPAEYITRATVTRRFMKRIALLGVLVLAGCDIDLSDLVDNCEYSRDMSDQISAAGIHSLLVDSDDGDVRVEGRNGSNEVRVFARACASNRRTLDDIEFDLIRSSNGSARVSSYVPSRDDALLELEIEVPPDFDIDIYDQAGHIDVENVYSVWLDDGSGDIDVFDIFGDVIVFEDGSGDIFAEDVGGDFIVERDGSGSIDYRNVRGRVRLP